MPDTLSGLMAKAPTYRQRLDGIASNFEQRERLDRGSALRGLKRDLDNLWRIARDEELDLIGVNDVR